ncbi:ribbon-helix-helix protein, CopG family [Sphaerisporangium fuscum]|uniref:ribbon-helix-helix protein, CopG family n=1 Tax=Sphaerisporangium fuscum TaxID=2835868 RepID=UPI001BDD1D1B|nr:ribbon-helix-helix protein, CopG family [Sphaerisporangium fuscum]
MTYQISVYLLPAAVRAAEEIRRRTGMTNAAIAYDALDVLRDRLAELLTARRSGPGRPSDSLFPSRRGQSTRVVAAREGRRQLWAMRATDAELEVIDRLCRQTGAKSRSELISCALEAQLLAPRRRGRPS